MKIKPVFFTKPVQVMAVVVVCCLSIGCSSPKIRNIEDTMPAISPDKQAAESSEKRNDKPNIDPVNEPQKQNGAVEIIEPVPTAEPSGSLSYHEVSAVFKGYTYVCSDKNALYGTVPKSGGCRNNVLNAYFEVTTYKRYEQHDPSGETQQKGVLFNSIPSDVQTILDSLTFEDTVQLHWNHTKGDARKYGTRPDGKGSIGGFLIQREITLLECLGTCGTGVVAQKPTIPPPWSSPWSSPTQMKAPTAASVMLLPRRVYVDKGGSMELSTGYQHSLTKHKIYTYFEENNLKEQMKDCQQKILESNPIDPKISGRLSIEIGITENMPFEISIKNSQIESEELLQCAEKVVERLEPFEHSLPFKAKTRMQVIFRYQ